MIEGGVVSGAREISADALGLRAQKAAAGLKKLGVGSGNSVALFLRNDIAFFEASLAAGVLGAYSTPVNWHYNAEEAGYIFENSDARAIVVHADLLPGIEAGLPEGVAVFVVPTPPEVQATYGIDPASCDVPADRTNWNAWTNENEPLAPSDVVAPGSMIYTSGTTGRPKGVRRTAPTPEQLMARVNTVGLVMGMTPGGNARTVITGPMYHSAPNAYGGLALQFGGTVYLQSRFDPEKLLAAIDRHKITHLHMVPTMFVRLLKLPAEVKGKYDLSSLEFVVHAAAPCPPDVKKGMIEWWGPVINEYYGSTEVGPVTFCGSADWLKHPGTVGMGVPNVTLRILDDDGNDVPQGEPGEIFCVNTGFGDFTYHKDDQKRRDSELDGLISVGDIGYLTDDGYLFLCDRKNDMVISGGVNIYPAEIEAALHNMPGVHDCAVFGIPDDEYGEKLCAVIEPEAAADLSADGVRAFAREHLAGYLVPKVVEFQTGLPREDSGKIFKRKLREPYWEQAGRQI
jgi:long-chain acyl-CoA synthetase